MQSYYMPYLNFCAEKLMMSVQHLMQAVQTSKPRFLCCEINADRTVINGSRTPRYLCTFNAAVQ